MSFTDHKITQFAHRVADLPDEPQIPAADLKSRFDACPEELRQSLNAVCDDAARLEARVEGIVVDTFGDTIDKEMLSDELAAELDGKATQTALSAEAAARESADDALQTAVSAKCELFCGTYTGDGAANRWIDLGFAPKFVLIIDSNGYVGCSFDAECRGGLFFPGYGLREQSPAVLVEGTGFRVYENDNKVRCNTNDWLYYYLAGK